MSWRPRDRTAIDVRLLGYRNRRDIDRLNARYSPRWWRRWRQRLARFLETGPVLVPVAVRWREERGYGFKRWERRR